MIFQALQLEGQVPFEIEYGTLANYSPKGNSELSEQSRNICGAIKAGKTDTLNRAIVHLKDAKSDILRSFLNSEVTLVPVPRSAPLTEGGLWPAMLIAEILQLNGFGKDILPLLRRTSAIRKSSYSPANERPLINEHIESFQVEMVLANPTQITLIDDVLTMGRTMCACAQILSDKFPDAKIRAFAMIRTQGFIPNIATIVEPSKGKITGYDSGKSHREP